MCFIYGFFVCVCVCVCVCVRARVRAYVCVCAFVHARARTQPCKYPQACMKRVNYYGLVTHLETEHFLQGLLHLLGMLSAQGFQHLHTVHFTNLCTACTYGVNNYWTLLGTGSFGAVKAYFVGKKL